MTMADQLTSDELRQVLADWISPYPPKQRRKIAGLFEAVIARAEAAEADNRRLTARVAELEAQAAQGWRDFTEHPPIGELIQIVTVIDAVREEPDGLYRIGHTSEWQTWRPAPQETE
jgi:hypothetical protein